MDKVTKRAERLARALWSVESVLNFDMAFDRAHWAWPECLEKAQEIISNMNLVEFLEDTRPLHGCVEEANADKDIYYAHYTGPGNHEKATALMFGWEEDNE